MSPNKKKEKQLDPLERLKRLRKEIFGADYVELEYESFSDDRKYEFAAYLMASQLWPRLSQEETMRHVQEASFLYEFTIPSLGGLDGKLAINSRSLEIDFELTFESMPIARCHRTEGMFGEWWIEEDSDVLGVHPHAQGCTEQTSHDIELSVFKFLNMNSGEIREKRGGGIHEQ